LVWLKNAEGNYLFCNQRFEQFIGKTEDQIVGKSDYDIVDRQLADFFHENDRQALEAENPCVNEEEVTYASDGHKEVLEIIKLPMYMRNGGLIGVLAIGRDITERKRQEEAILHQAHYDTLTNLPNRWLAVDRLEQILKEAWRDSTQVAVLFLDLDDFKKVNDSLGHEVGDQLLIQCGQRLGTVLRDTDTIGRLGGDEFIVLLDGLKDGRLAQQVADNLLSLFSRPFNVEGRQLTITASIGIALYPADGSSTSELLRNSDAAMYHAKHKGRNNCSFFTEQMNLQVAKRMAIEEQLHGAMERGEFAVHYQPQIELSTGRVVGAEALLRWHNPTMVSISPAEFIPITEQTGLIVPLGEFVLSEALSACKQWRHEFNSQFRIAVNLSPRQVRDTVLVSYLQTLLEKLGVGGEVLELEITEGVLMSGQANVEACLRDLIGLGISIAMDDFGTGYSSLSYLRSYPFHTLKIDRSFITDISVDESDRQLIRAAISMARALSMEVVAEGIETDEQLNYLQELGCDYGQGYLISKPLTEEALTRYLEC